MFENCPRSKCYMISAVVQVADKSKDEWIHVNRTSMYHYDFGDGCMKQLPQESNSVTSVTKNLPESKLSSS